MTSPIYLPYAGIGSRDTPEHVLKVMAHLSAYLYTQGWTLRSGGADGADRAFEWGVNSMADLGKTLRDHAKEIYLPWAGFNNNPSELHPGNIPFSDEEISVSASFHPAWDKCSPSARKLHQRNLRQLLGCQAVCGDQVQMSKFVVCWTPNGDLRGGTSQALRIAIACEIPIFNFGFCQTPDAIETMMVQIDELQAKIKKEAGIV